MVQFHLPQWPLSSSEGRIVCAEVKTKSTSAKSSPISAAVTDSAKDRKSRLATTLVWLRERAILGDFSTVTFAHLERFIKAEEHPPAVHDFRAVAVIHADLLSDELSEIAVPPKDECTLVVISVPDLKANYEKLYDLLIVNAAVEVMGP